MFPHQKSEVVQVLVTEIDKSDKVVIVKSSK